MASAVYWERESNLDAISLSNCPKLSDNPRIKTVEYTVESKVGTYLHTGGSEKNGLQVCSELSKYSQMSLIYSIGIQ